VCQTVGTAGTVCYDTYCTTVVVTTPCAPIFSWVEDSLNIGTGTVIFQVINSCGGAVTWTFGDGTSGTGNSTTHQFGTAGWFWVCASVNIQGVIQTFCDSVYSNRLSGLNDINGLGELSISPNPASDFTVINFNATNEIKLDISMSAVTGQVVFESKAASYAKGEHTVKIDLSQVANGLYVVKIQSGTSLITKKILVQ
jgi:hypothetical protein